METIIFQNRECYVGYKGLEENGWNFQQNFQYESGNWYRTLDVDMSNEECSYGINLCYNPVNCLKYGKVVYKVYVPVDQNIYFGNDKFRCQLAYIDGKVNIDVDKYWDGLNESQLRLIQSNWTE